MNDDLPLSAEDVAEIVAILSGSPYREVDISTGRVRLRIARADGEESGFTQEWQWAGTEETDRGAVVDEAVADPSLILASLPGIFYHAPQPGTPPFVSVGDAVDADTVVGIVETMKLMNPVYAGQPGIVAEILVPDATMVAKGQALLRVV
jgi:biotin carboxyl carrier protein